MSIEFKSNLIRSKNPYIHLAFEAACKAWLRDPDLTTEWSSRDADRQGIDAHCHWKGGSTSLQVKGQFRLQPGVTPFELKNSRGQCGWVFNERWTARVLCWGWWQHGVAAFMPTSRLSVIRHAFNSHQDEFDVVGGPGESKLLLLPFDWLKLALGDDFVIVNFPGLASRHLELPAPEQVEQLWLKRAS